MTRLAICCGLTRLNPDAYDGWPGECPGCDRDAARVAKLAHDRGFDGVTVLVNQAVQPANVKSVFTSAAKQLQAGDLLLVYNSGHGGQQPDEEGDETDGLDETLCWWSGEVLDDTIGKYLARLRSGVRVLYVTDTCNSGTNYRGRSLVRRGTTPYRPKKLRGVKASVLHFGGCSDGRSSFGSEDGGVYTNALLNALKSARKPISYGAWFCRSLVRMPTYQRPVFGEFGGPSFADGIAME